MSRSDDGLTIRRLSPLTRLLQRAAITRVSGQLCIGIRNCPKLQPHSMR